MKIEREDDYDYDYESIEEIFIIIEREDDFYIKLGFYPHKVDNCTFRLCRTGKNITISEFEEFIEKLEQNMYCALDIHGSSENNIVHHPDKMYILKWYKDYLNISISMNQEARTNFVEGFKRFLVEVKDICNMI